MPVSSPPDILFPPVLSSSTSGKNILIISISYTSKKLNQIFTGLSCWYREDVVQPFMFPRYFVRAWVLGNFSSPRLSPLVYCLTHQFLVSLYYKVHGICYRYHMYMSHTEVKWNWFPTSSLQQSDTDKPWRKGSLFASVGFPFTLKPTYSFPIENKSEVNNIFSHSSRGGTRWQLKALGFLI
jgi:hypothetical protein